MSRLISLFVVLWFPLGCIASVDQVPLQHAKIDLHDKASLQRGIKLYINYCLGCHSLAYLRYNRMAKGAGILNAAGEIAKDLVTQNLIFTGAKITDPILSSMPEKAQEWFGVKPPDLTLITKIRGADWVYTYLKSFYLDSKRPWGVNNLVFPDVSMPNVLAPLQGLLVPVYKEKLATITGTEVEEKVPDHLALVAEGSMTEHQFNSAMNDLVNFLVFSAEPEKITSRQIGVGVIAFLLLFALVSYVLKREYWKDIKK